MQRHVRIGISITALATATVLVSVKAISHTDVPHSDFVACCEDQSGSVLLTEEQVKSILGREVATPLCPCDNVVKSEPMGKCCAAESCEGLPGTEYQVKRYIIECDGKRFYYCIANRIQCCSNPPAGRDKEGCINDADICRSPGGSMPKCRPRTSPTETVSTN